MHDAMIEQFYQELESKKPLNFVEKIEWISRQFLGKPYLNGALGEGEQGRFDQRPLYRVDQFDCVTFVNTVLALALSNNLAQFQKNIIKINYYDAEPLYEKRFHFMSVDWNVQNAKQGLVQDITKTIKDSKGQTLFENAIAEIDRPNWFLYRTKDDIKLKKSLSLEEEKNRLTELHAHAKKVHAEKSFLPYLPLEKLFQDEKIFGQIPSGSIVEIVRPNWNLREKIGTNLNISHLGFVFKIKEELIFRHASLLDEAVAEIKLKDYLSVYQNHETIKGINVQKTMKI